MEVAGKFSVAKQDLHLCENCQFENVTREAKGICQHCEEYMCDTCFRHHLKGKRNRHHGMIDMNDPDITAKQNAGEMEKCKQHDNEAIKFYCRKHEVVGCGDCIIFKHRTCNAQYIKDLSKNIQGSDDFINIKRKFKELERQNIANIEKIQKNRKDSKAMCEEALAEIRKFRADINYYLDMAESAIISEMMQVVSDNDRRLDQLDIDCAICTCKIEDLKKKLETTVQRENVLFIQTVRSKASVQEIEHELSKTVQSISEDKRYEFVPNQQLASIIKSRGKLGKLIISNRNEPKRDTSIFRELRNPLQQETDMKADVRPSSVVVGSLVKRNHPCMWSDVG